MGRDDVDADRVARGLTKSALARRAGVSRPTVYNALNGEDVMPETLQRIYRALYEVPVVRVVEHE